MPMDRALYPAHWKDLALAPKVAAGWRCQWCGARHGDLVKNRLGKVWRVSVGVAHLDHDPQNPQARLAVLCHRCHCRYDASRMQRGRKARMMAMARGQLPLFEELRQ